MPTFMIIAMYAFALVGFGLIVNPYTEWKSRWVTLGYGFMLVAVCIALVWLISVIVS